MLDIDNDDTNRRPVLNELCVVKTKSLHLIYLTMCVFMKHLLT